MLFWCIWVFLLIMIICTVWKSRQTGNMIDKMAADIVLLVMLVAFAFLSIGRWLPQ